MKFDNLFKHIKKTNGIFLEAGAFDGAFQSYTYSLEQNYGWTGVLIEPSVNAFNICKQNRPNSICVNIALVDDPLITSIVGDFDGSPMSSINGLRLNRESQIEVAATTLTKIFDEYFSSKTVDLMSIDVENYELEVLKGLNFTKYQTQFILLEISKSVSCRMNILKGIFVINNSVGDKPCF